MNYETTGRIKHIGQVQQVSDKFMKLEFVIEVQDGNYSDLIKFALKQDKTDVLNNQHIGDEIKVHFNLRGREWTKDGKTSYFTNLEAWKIELVSQAQAVVAEPVYGGTPQSREGQLPVNDDLPF